MAYNTAKTTAPIRGLVNSGADLLVHMYDAKIYFPSANGLPDANPFLSYPITVRLEGFKVPDVEVGTYDIKYHGISIKRPNGWLQGDRQIELSFREDAAFDLRRRFSAWMMAVGDPVTGGVSNAAQFFGQIEVGTIAGAYFATTVNTPNGTGKKNDAGGEDIEDTYGHLTTRNKMNPLAMWSFYNVWVNKVSQPDFKTEGTDTNKIAVTFQYMDCDFPQFGGNTLDLGANGSWQSPLAWTQKLD
jgi:hypothetical protein